MRTVDAADGTPSHRCEGRPDEAGGSGRTRARVRAQSGRQLRRGGSCAGGVTIGATRRVGRVTALEFITDTLFEAVDRGLWDADW